jgi:hypothetical protein
MRKIKVGIRLKNGEDVEVEFIDLGRLITTSFSGNVQHVWASSSEPDKEGRAGMRQIMLGIRIKDRGHFSITHEPVTVPDEATDEDIEKIMENWFAENIIGGGWIEVTGMGKQE